MGKYKGFTSVELRRPQRSTFDLSHEKRVSSRIGKLTPILITETMPNDTFYGSSEVLLKLAPMIAPIFHRMNLYVHYFFVPNRLIWDEWEPFITGGRLGAAVTNPPVPPCAAIDDILQLNFDLLDTRSLADYLGIPPIADISFADWDGRSIDLMPFVATFRVWYDYYRDRNYTDDIDQAGIGSGPILSSGLYTGAALTEIATWGIFNLRYRCWEHDYFTSSMLTTQRGSEVLMPMEGSGSVTYLPVSELKDFGGGTVDTGSIMQADNTSELFFGSTEGAKGRVENIDEVEMTNSSVSINDLRRAVQLQAWLERNQLAGSRYNESIMAHFGRKTSDGRLQRAEYLGGGKAVVQISEVMTTAFSEDAASEVVPPGNPSGRGSVYSDTNRFSYNCEEHGFIIGMLSVMPTSGYMQGLPRMFQQRNTFLDYPWPSFAHLGEQEVYDNEIYMTPSTLVINRNQQPVFGYQSRYVDWKHISSSSHGDFRTSLDFWHLTRDFGALPVLSEAFVTFEDALQDRIFNVSGSDTLWMYIYNKLHVKRSLPYFGTPRL